MVYVTTRKIYQIELLCQRKFCERSSFLAFSDSIIWVCKSICIYHNMKDLLSWTALNEVENQVENVLEKREEK